LGFWATVCKTVRPMLSDRCLSVCPVLSVCDVGVLWPNGWTDQDETLHAGRSRPWPHCLRRGPSSPSPKVSAAPSNSRPISVVAKWLDGSRCHLVWSLDRTRSGVCVRWGPSFPLPKKGTEPPPQFSAHVHCGQTAGWIKMALGMEVGLGPGHIVLDGDPALLPKKRSPLPNFRPISIASNGWMHQDATWYGGRPQPRRLCVRWGPSPPPQEGWSPSSVYMGVLRPINPEPINLIFM